MPVLAQLALTSGGERYLHGDELRHRPAPQGLSHEQWWLAEKLSRRGTGTPLPLLSSDGSPFWFCQPPLLLKGLHEIDRKAGAAPRPLRADDPQHLPADAGRLRRFANGETTKVFLHPVVRAIALHFWLAYDHPFCDGNGRTAQALFYWAMLHQSYWLFAFVSISSVINKARGRHGVSHQTARSDLQKLAARGLLLPGKDGRPDIFKVPEDLSARLPG